MIGNRTCAKTENATTIAARRAGSPRQRWTALVVARGFFERVGQLQDAEVVPVSADDLSSHGQPFRREAAGYRGGGRTGNGHIVARLHPIYVGLHPFSVDLRDGALTLKTVRESGGIALAVSDKDTLEAGRFLARMKAYSWSRQLRPP